MADYKGNFYSTKAYSPDYNVNELSGILDKYTVTAADVTATKSKLTKEVVANVLAIVYRAGVALPTNYTISVEGDGVYLKGNGNYTLTAGDVVLYIAQK